MTGGYTDEIKRMEHDENVRLREEVERLRAERDVAREEARQWQKTCVQIVTERDALKGEARVAAARLRELIERLQAELAEARAMVSRLDLERFDLENRRDQLVEQLQLAIERCHRCGDALRRAGGYDRPRCSDCAAAVAVVKEKKR